MEYQSSNKVLMVEAGDVLDGRFRLDNLLGQGAQGLVWLATDLGSKGQSSKSVALKLFM